MNNNNFILYPYTLNALNILVEYFKLFKFRYNVIKTNKV